MINQIQKNALFLRKLNPDFAQPFTLQLENGDHFECYKILRILPKKRLVAFAKWNNKEIVAKIFFDRFSAKKHFNREIKGNALLTRKKILTPKIFYSGKTKGEYLSYVLLFERIIPDAALQFTRNTELTEEEKRNFGKLLQLLYKLHKNGFYLNDLHPSNFIFTSRGFYIIDTAQLSVENPNFLNQIKNLSHMLAQFFPAYFRIAKWMYEPYFTLLNQDQFLSSNCSHIRGKQRSNETNRLNAANYNLSLIKKYLKQHHKKIQKHFLKKIFRSSTKLIQHKTFKFNGIFDRSLSNKFPKSIREIDAHMAQGQILKAGNTCTVVHVNINGVDCVIKRYNIKNFRHRLKRLLQKSRAAKSWKNSFMLLFHGIQTPKPLTMIEERIGLLRAKSYFITEYINGTALKDYCLDKTNEKTFEKIAEQLSKIFIFFKKNYMRHGDMKADNFLVFNNQIYLIDLESIKPLLPFIYKSKKIFEKDLLRFMKNWKNCPDIKKFFTSRLYNRLAKNKKHEYH